MRNCTKIVKLQNCAKKRRRQNCQDRCVWFTSKFFLAIFADVRNIPFLLFTDDNQFNSNKQLEAFLQKLLFHICLYGAHFHLTKPPGEQFCYAQWLVCLSLHIFTRQLFTLLALLFTPSFLSVFNDIEVMFVSVIGETAS